MCCISYKNFFFCRSNVNSPQSVYDFTITKPESMANKTVGQVLDEVCWVAYQVIFVLRNNVVFLFILEPTKLSLSN